MLILTYLVATAGALWLAVVSTKRYKGARWRRAVVSLVAAVCLAPSYVGGGHGYAVGPAWAAAWQQLFADGGSSLGFWTLGVLPVAGIALLCFVVAEVWVGVHKE